MCSVGRRFRRVLLPIIWRPVANLQRRFARREADLEEGAALARWQQNMEWGGEAHELLGPVDAPWAWPTASLQPLAPTALYRTIAVVAVDRLDAVLPVVAAQRDYLQTAGIAAGPEELYRLGGLLECGWRHAYQCHRLHEHARSGLAS